MAANSIATSCIGAQVKEDVVQTVDAELTGYAFLALDLWRLALPGEPVDDIEDTEKDARHEQHRQKHRLERPLEVDPLEKSEEERGVSERRQRASDVGHEEDEEYEDMGLLYAMAVRLDHGPDQHH